MVLSNQNQNLIAGTRKYKNIPCFYFASPHPGNWLLHLCKEDTVLFETPSQWRYQANVHTRTGVHKFILLPEINIRRHVLDPGFQE